ncbi:MAG: carbamoyltransferase HypF, partial [Roseobacter sp.]|nr:carbamoyltransferase HypF [Roseobacter sp.]
FEIIASSGQGSETRVTPDAATCADCLADVQGRDPRRAGYAFTNCTHCGPRFTIITGVPYDRARTSMAVFKMCAPCAAEYGDPADRRFHAQPVACRDCGPQLWFETDAGRVAGDAVARAAEALRKGAILAVKGLGGFHLCCDARNAQAIATLRHRKNRPAKPLALMDLPERINAYAKVSAAEEARLRDAAAPIVLLHKKGDILPEVLAPGLDVIGVMHPYTPLHHLLLARAGGPLVMTSGNLSGEPQVILNAEARAKLDHIVDGYLMHDRDILRRLDDSVESEGPGGPMILRRARGRVPETLPLPAGFEQAPQTLAFGGHLKASICLTKNGQALLSHHLGDLDDLLTWDEFLKADADYAELFDHAPTVFACDLHEGYRSSQHAHARAAGAPLVAVQHHHAHMAAAMVENGWPLDGGKVAGVILDGLGLGTDGTIWGGEVLLGDYRDYTRHAYLAPVPLVGGEAAQREPWRTAVMRLDRVGHSAMADLLFDTHPVALIRQAARSGLNAPPGSSAGRLFDAFAATLGLVAGAQSFEGEAAMALEALARRAPTGDAEKPYIFATGHTNGALDDSELWAAWAADRAAGIPETVMARRFHAGVAASFVHSARHLIDTGAAKAVALSGGCFQNALLLQDCLALLQDVPVLVHHRVPANDGGLALGQAAVAAARTLRSR